MNQFQEKNVIAGVGIGAIMTLLFLLAVRFGLFWIFAGYDDLLHIMGGLVIGFFVRAIVSREKSFMNVLVVAGISGFVIGAAWEIFERVGYLFLPEIIQYGSTVDTLRDIAYAILGALIIIIISRIFSETSYDRITTK